MWCELEGAQGFRLRVDHDYYLFAELPAGLAGSLERLTLPSGIYAEQMDAYW